MTMRRCDEIRLTRWDNARRRLDAWRRAPSRLTARERLAVLAVLLEPGHTAEHYAPALGVGIPTARRLLTDLAVAGELGTWDEAGVTGYTTRYGIAPGR